MCARRGSGGIDGREGGGEDEDRGNGPLPGARVLRLRDITESRSAESRWAGVGDREGKRASTFVHVRLKFSVGFQ